MVKLSSPMENDWVRLEQLTLDHKDDLFRPATQEALWNWMPYRPSGSGLEQYFENYLSEAHEDNLVPFAVISKQSDELVGVTALMSISRHHRRLEIGHTWYMAAARGTMINPAAKLLLLGRAFEWGALRVEFKTDIANTVSRAAIRKLGAREEGILRSYVRMLDGTRRDTVCFSILKDEWPRVREKLIDRLENRADRVSGK